jgi:hypothetical protein
MITTRDEILNRTPGSPPETPCDGTGANHEWVVFSTALQEVWLMVICVQCGAHGSVDDPSLEEWTAAYHAPSNPYHWHDAARVTIRGKLNDPPWLNDSP